MMDLSWSCYEILGAAEDANYEEIKSKYRAAVLALHPDKLLVVSSNTSGQEEDNRSVKWKSKHEFDFGYDEGDVGEAQDGGLLSRFFRVQKAWEVLRDPKSRASYDRTLSAERFAREVALHGGDSVRAIAEEIYLGDMDVMSRHAGGLIHDEEGDRGGEGERVVEDEDEGFSYPCRCGDCFVVSNAELRGMGVEVGKEFPLQAEAMDGRGVEGAADDWERDSRNGALQYSGAPTSREETNVRRKRANSEQAQRPRPDSLVLPCQSCSLHVRLHLRNKV